MNRLLIVSLLLVIACTFSNRSAIAQLHGRGIELFDGQWQPISDEKLAQFQVRKRKLDKQTTQTCFYKAYGPLIRIETNNDQGVPNGPFVWYDNRGHADSMGNYINGLREGDWYYYNDSFKVDRKNRYANGLLVDSKDYRAERNLPRQKDPTAVAARFDDVPGSWGVFLNKTLRYPAVAIKNNIQGNVYLRFVLDENGQVTEPWIQKSVDISLDDESLRIIKLTPAWIPAEKDGKAIKSFMLQPISYRLQD
ncbi:energy transducer TonB [Paraflavitalea pollutisoli]|uniref:energy transducer TonB n=1 Tax=Paraflavitalea pollutisoli TaxID=3034143 RepID=UPI0023EDD52F|nr:energy transducer TonB [Paraflavitalea sp. H1-2-19X]